MPAAINLQKVIISGWKAIDENPVEIQFDGDSWLIYGGNETGKSLPSLQLELHYSSVLMQKAPLQMIG